MYSRSVSSFCVELSSCRVGGCRVGSPPILRIKAENVDLCLSILQDYDLVFLLKDQLRRRNSGSQS